MKAQRTDGTTPAPKSVADMADQIKSAQVEHYSGEAGPVSIRLRGARAFEPSYYFNALPLTSASSGEQNLDLLPSSSFGSLEIYPDSTPFWLSSMGISGDIDVISCRRADCFMKESNSQKNLLKGNAKVGSFGYKQFETSDSFLFNKQTQIISHVEYTASKENYLVFNNGNSTLNPTAGTYEDLQNNDFQKIGSAVGATAITNSLGKISSDFAFGNENKGIPGVVGTVSDVRLKRSLFVTTLRSEKLFPSSGIQWNNQLAGLYNSSQLTSALPIFSIQGTTTQSSTLQLKSWVIVPTDFIRGEESGFSFEMLQFNTNSQTSVASNPAQSGTDTKVTRKQYRVSLFEALLFPINDYISFSASVNGWYAGSNTDTNTWETPLFGDTLSAQAKIYSLVSFARYATTQRQPYLFELYGSPGGILPNPALIPESSHKFEAGFSSPYGEAGYFQARDQNIIFLQQTSPVTAQYQNIENSTRHGFYIDAEYDVMKYWKNELNYQYVIAKDEQNNFLPRSPMHYATASTALEKIPLGNIFEFKNFFSAYANIKYESPFYIDYANINQMDISPLYGFGTSVFFLGNQKKFILSFDIYNATDEKFAFVTNTTGLILQVNSNGYFAFPPPGRRFYVSLTGEF